MSEQERLVLLSLGFILTFGTAAHYAFQKYPVLRDSVNLIESDTFYAKVDVNTSTAEELESVPYIGAYTAANIVAYRLEHGAFRSLEELKSVKGIREKNYVRFRPYLKVARESGQ